MKKLLYESSEKAVSLAKAERWADVAVNVFFAEERGVDEPVGLETDHFLGVGVSLPLPLLDQKKGSIQSSRARQRQIQHELEQVELRLRSEACAQKLRVESLYLQARAYEENFFQMMSETLGEADAAYRAGQISLTEFFRLQEQSLRLQSAQLTALRDFELAMIDWKAATASNNNIQNPLIK
jgi:cobalt-zinc-cadmium efflux system outer membrane protein